MEPRPIDEKSLREYLLGRLDGSECAEIDEKIFADNNFAETVGLAEDEIIEDYLEGTLSGPERQAAEDHFFQSPEHLHKLHFAQLLRRQLGKKKHSDYPRPISPPIPKAFYWAAAISIVVLLALTTGLGIYTAKLRGEVAAERAKNKTLQDVLELTRQRIKQDPRLQQDEQVQNQEQNGGQEISVVISPIPIDREVGATTLTKYHSGAKWLEIHIALIDFSAPTYSAVLKTAKGQEVWSGTNLKASVPGKLLVLKVPYKLLSPGTYSLLINGREYGFRIG
jgi:hypothetical protein